MERRNLFALLGVVFLAVVEVPAVHSDAPIDRTEAFRFLTQATFGPTQSGIDHLIQVGYADWIDEQMAIPPSLQLPVLQALNASGVTKPTTLNTLRQDTWFRTAVIGPDQLRQRVAFALSEIMVVSQNSVLQQMPLATADYYDVLTRNAFGNFRQLIEEVTLHPAMGKYLSMLGNQKPDAALNIRPDENFARELMQLFTIGLVQLNLDGTVQVSDSGEPLATYDQSVVEGFANVFTGWNYAGATSFSTAKRANANQSQPMKAYPEQHSPLAKRLLDYPGVSQTELPPSQTPDEDLAAALDNIFNHPSVGPFIARRLIQRLVTSNPSSAYVARVASVFNDDGNGQRGQLGAVVRAILLDTEARPDLATASDVTGKVKEPLLRLTQLWRAYDARSQNGVYRVPTPDDFFGQGPLLSASVFNFFVPAYAPQGEIADRGLVAPEMQIATEYLNARVTDYFLTQVFNRNSTKAGLASTIIVINIADEVALASDADALVQGVARKLLGGRISPLLADEARKFALRYPTSQPAKRVADVMYLIVTSPEFAVQR